MLEGKRFFPETGTPIWKMDRMSVVFAVWLPEPFTVATCIEKSLFDAFNVISASKLLEVGQAAHFRPLSWQGQERGRIRLWDRPLRGRHPCRSWSVTRYDAARNPLTQRNYRPNNDRP